VKKVVVGVVTYNSREHIDRCLESLEAQTSPHIEAVILDNDSPDGTARWIAERWPQYRLVANEINVGFGCAHNQIIALTTSDYYMPLNPDVVLTPGYVAAMVDAIEAAPDIGWVCGKLLYTSSKDGAPTQVIYTVGHAVFPDGSAINIGFRELDGGQFEEAREIFGANGAAPLYRRAMLEAVQARPGEAFDATMFLYLEDVDLDWRARLLGWRCFYTPKAIAYHAHGASGGDRQPSIIKRVTANRYYLVLKNGFLLDLLLFNIPALVGHALFMLVTEPRRGMATISSLLSRAGEIRYKRHWMASRRKLSRSDIRRWFRWSRQQKHRQPGSYLQRFWRFRIVKTFYILTGRKFYPDI
jgi:GT2 family glycosyltransferase